MLKRLLTYCLLLLPVCTVMADGVDRLGSIRDGMKADGFINPCIIAVPYQGTLNPCDYNAWGRQTVSRDSIGICQGYTGQQLLLRGDRTIDYS